MPKELTPRQLDLCIHLANGHRPEEIAQIMHLSLSSVNRTISRARKNAGARTQAHLVAIVMASGLMKFNPDGEVVHLNAEGPAIPADPSHAGSSS